MKFYRAEPSAELEFAFPDELSWNELDRQGTQLPHNMKLVDLVIERDDDVLLVEIKDPSVSRSPDKERKAYLARLTNDSIRKNELTPKARDSYLYLHLMEQDRKPIKFVVLIGLDAYDDMTQKALLGSFADRLSANIACEMDTAWRRKHIAACVVLSVATWNKQFPEWPVARKPRIEQPEVNA